MRYAIIVCNNSNFTVKSEWSDLTQAKVSFHGLCETLWNSSDVIAATVMIVNEYLCCVDGYQEYITHPVVVEEPTEE